MTTSSRPSESNQTYPAPSPTSLSDTTYENDRASEAEHARKAAKAGNKNGDPLRMKSKILAAVPDPASPSTSIFIAESAGYVRRVNLDVSCDPGPWRRF